MTPGSQQMPWCKLISDRTATAVVMRHEEFVSRSRSDRDSHSRRFLLGNRNRGRTKFDSVTNVAGVGSRRSSNTPNSQRLRLAANFRTVARRSAFVTCHPVAQRWLGTTPRNRMAGRLLLAYCNTLRDAGIFGRHGASRRSARFRNRFQRFRTQVNARYTMLTP